MLLLRLYTDLSVCSAIVGASYAGVPCPGALVANLSKSQQSQVDFINICISKVCMLHLLSFEVPCKMSSVHETLCERTFL